MSDARALTCVVAVLIVTDVVLMDQNMWLTVPVACVSTLLLLVIARSAGLTPADLGLARSRLAIGLKWGLAAAAIVAAGYLIIALLPVGQEALDDDSMPTTVWEAAVKVLVVIPLRTILLEEFAFRGVLWGLLLRRWGVRWATMWSAVAFGLWHVPAGVRLADSNQALESATASSPFAIVGVVVAIVLFTAAASVLFTELRRRSGSLVAPAGLHWATNGMGTIVSAVK